MKTTLLKKLLTFILPMTMIPFIVVMIFFYMYIHRVVENDIIIFQKSILMHMVQDIEELIDEPLKLASHLNEEHLYMPEISIFDKEMNLVTKNFHIEYSEEFQEYNRESLLPHFQKILHSQNSDILHDEQYSVLIKPVIKNNELVAFITSGYKSALDRKMVAITQTLLFLLFLMIFSVFLISIFIFIFSLKLLHPIGLLIEGIKKITAGDLSFIIENVSDDEISDVVDAFNDMNQKRKRIEEELEEMATHDGLTGLYNHKYFYVALENEISRVDRYNNTLSLLLIDIDHFKNVNDIYGHRAGDTILSALSQRLMTRIRDTDIASRYGGEEIAVILVETNMNVAQSIAEELRILIEKEPFEIEGGEHISITVSIGISYYCEDAKEASTLVSHADKALYKAKKNGRNRVRIF